jgi:hypothetical protein
MVADALIYHPTVSHYLKFIATTGASCYIPSTHPIHTIFPPPVPASHPSAALTPNHMNQH